MKLSVLTENTAGGKFLAEHGLSYIIELNGQTFLFDTGHTDVFLQNAVKLGVDIHKSIETIILSHGHWDHGNGLQYLNNKTLIVHPSAFIKRYRINDKTNIGLALSKQQLEHNFKLITSKEPYKISENIIFLGEIPRLTDFEAKSTPFADENGNPDFIPDDSALAVIQDCELVVITGCSHSGICNIIEQAKKVTGIDKVNAVVGGFHLKHNDQQTQQTVQYLKNHKIKNIFPSHCIELPALVAFYNEFKIQQLKTGAILEL